MARKSSTEYKALLRCASDLTVLLKNNTVSVSTKLLEKGLVTEEVHDEVLTMQGVSNQDKAARLVFCVTDRVKVSAQQFHDFVDVLKEAGPYFKDIVEKLSSEHGTYLSLSLILDGMFSLIPTFLPCIYRILTRHGLC